MFHLLKRSKVHSKQSCAACSFACDRCTGVFVPAPFAGCTLCVQRRGNAAAFPPPLRKRRSFVDRDGCGASITRTMRPKEITLRVFVNLLVRENDLVSEIFSSFLCLLSSFFHLLSSSFQWLQNVSVHRSTYHSSYILDN